jgi:hypothetical protein
VTLAATRRRGEEKKICEFDYLLPSLCRRVAVRVFSGLRLRCVRRAAARLFLASPPYGRRESSAATIELAFFRF